MHRQLGPPRLKALGLLGVGAALLLLAATILLSASSSLAASVTVDGSRKFQRIDGFGVNAIPKTWQGGALRPAIDLLVDQGSLLWRVDVGSGHTLWEATNDDADPNNFSWSYYGTVYSQAAFEDLWSELSYLNSKGITSDLELSMSGLVPDWMGGTVIDPTAEDEFVEQIASLLYFARNMRGIQFGKVSPLNETDQCAGVEGPCVGPAQYARIMNRLAEKLDNLGMGDVELVGPHTISFDTSYTQALMQYPAAMNHIKAFAYHNYVGCGSCASSTAGFVQGSAFPDRRIWVGEWNNSATDGWLDDGHQVADEWVFARTMTDYLLNFLEGGASAVLAWDAWDNWHEHNPCCAIDRWGELYQDSAGVYQAKKRYYTNQQIFKFVLPGMVRMAAASADGNIRVYAFMDDTTGHLTLTGRNRSTSPQTLTISLSHVPTVTALAMYQTTVTKNTEREADASVVGGGLTVTVDADSFFTLTTVGLAARGIDAGAERYGHVEH